MNLDQVVSCQCHRTAAAYQLIWYSSKNPLRFPATALLRSVVSLLVEFGSQYNMLNFNTDEVLILARTTSSCRWAGACRSVGGYAVPPIPPEGQALNAYTEHCSSRATTPTRRPIACTGGRYSNRSSKMPSSSSMGPTIAASTSAAVGHGGTAAASKRCSATLATCWSPACSPLLV
jgi:hypothetical protein